MNHMQMFSSQTIVLFVGLGALLGLTVVLYLRSVESRKRYACPSCGEQQTVELMDASRCNTCGAPLQRQ